MKQLGAAEDLLELRAAEVKGGGCHLCKSRLSSADLVGKTPCVSPGGGGLEVGFRWRFAKGRVVGQ